MGKARSMMLGGVIGAAVGVVLAPRRGESRGEALDRLRIAARPRRGAVRAFSGTPCAAEDAAVAPDHGGAARAAAAAATAAEGGDEDG